MAAQDYMIVAGWQNAYLAKRTKGNRMSSDRRAIEDNEIIGLFEFYLRNYCEKHQTDGLVISNGDGKKLFEAQLLDTKKKQ